MRNLLEIANLGKIYQKYQILEKFTNKSKIKRSLLEIATSGKIYHNGHFRKNLPEIANLKEIQFQEKFTMNSKFSNTRKSKFVKYL